MKSKVIKLVSIKKSVNQNGSEDMRGRFVGSFVKRNGEIRKMEFGYSKNLIQSKLENGEMISVFEILGKDENGDYEGQMRKFNLGQIIGDLVQVN
ncbi:MAG TPA: hypothetical protein EYQ21_00195 [Flavobacteriales bacterium]|nr:hypothetical protein [Flavobacteriales bacterium]